MLSYIVVGILFTAILKSDGLLNRFLSALGFTAYIDWLGNGKIAMVSVIMLDVWMWTGFLAAIYIAGLQAIPRDYYEAARIDGANGVQQFFAISLPMLAPSLQICITLSLVGGIGAFEQILVLTNGGRAEPPMSSDCWYIKHFRRECMARPPPWSCPLRSSFFC